MLSFSTNPTTPCDRRSRRKDHYHYGLLHRCKVIYNNKSNNNTHIAAAYVDLKCVIHTAAAAVKKNLFHVCLFVFTSFFFLGFNSRDSTTLCDSRVYRFCLGITPATHTTLKLSKVSHIAKRTSEFRYTRK